jgi:hypothetical protein
LLLFGLWRYNKGLVMAGLLLVISCGVLAPVQEESGEKAEKVLKQTRPDTHDWVHKHEESAEKLMPVMLALALLGIVALVFTVLNSIWGRRLSFAVLVLTLPVWLFAGYVGWQGGQISHPELRPGSAASPTAPAEFDDD